MSHTAALFAQWEQVNSICFGELREYANWIGEAWSNGNRNDGVDEQKTQERIQSQRDRRRTRAGLYGNTLTAQCFDRLTLEERCQAAQLIPTQEVEKFMRMSTKVS